MDTIKAFIFTAPFLLLLAVGMRAQEPVFYFQHLGKEEGLTDNSFNTLLTKDSRGFLWISSLQGVYRFDGSVVKHYPIPPMETGEELSQNIQSAFWEDRNGNLWFTSVSALHCFERKKGAIRNIRFQEKGEGVKNNYHAFHLEQNSGALWVKAGESVFTYNVYSGQASAPLFQTAGVRFSVDSTAAGAVRIIYACPWWNGPGLEIWATGEAPGAWASVPFQDGVLGRANISKAIPGKDDKLWLLSNLGLIGFSPGEGKQLQVYQPPGIPDFDCWDGAAWNAGAGLVLTSRNHGLWYFNASRALFTQNWAANPSLPHSLSTNSPASAYASPDHQLWVSHNRVGIDYSQQRPAAFANPLERISPGGAGVRSIIEGPDQKIWVLTEPQGVFTFNRSGHLLHQFSSQEGGFDFGAFSQLSQDASGTTWAVDPENIYRYSQGESQWEQVYSGEQRLLSLFHESPKRNWVVTTAGVYELVARNAAFRLIPASEFADYQGFEFDYFFKAGAQTIFIPFNSQSLWVVVRKRGEQVIRQKFPELASDTYGAQASRFSDTIWIATEKGLYGYSNEKLFPVLGPAQFDGPCSIYGVVEDKAGSLWLSSNRGLWYHNRRTGELLRLGQADGLPSENFTPGAALLASDGKIWLGTDRGLAVFHPDSIPKQFPIPQAHIEAVWVNNAPYDPGFAVSEAAAFALNYRQNTLAFELKTVGYYQPKASQLKYRLLGYDDNWASVPNGGFARFTKIPPGQYSLEVLPLNANGQAGPKHTLAIGIKPPFWQTLWFKISSVLAVLLLVAGIVGAFYRRKLRKQRELLERQQALNEERNRIAKELHDDMGSSLSSILFLSEDLLLEDDSGPKHEVQRISSLAENSLENMREIIWAMDSDKNTLPDLSSHLRAFATDFLTDNKIRFELDFPALPAETYTLGGERRRNVYLIAKEALHNTVKHAQAKQVRVALKLDGQQIILEIQDDGRGFEVQAQAASGHGLNNMKGRATAIGGQLELQSRPGEGTLLRLSVPL